MKPTPNQLEILEKALSDGYFHDKPIGLVMNGASVTTLAILRERGWIVEDLLIRDPATRAERERIMWTYIATATDHLNNGDGWELALTDLREAAAIKHNLARRGNWITDAGKEIAQGLVHAS